MNITDYNFFRIGLLPEALRSKCGKCSNNQKESALRVLKKLYSTYPNYYNDLREKWDTSGEYHRKFEQYLQEEQFNSISDGRIIILICNRNWARLMIN